MAQKRRNDVHPSDEPKRRRSSRAAASGGATSEREPVRRLEEGIRQSIFEWLCIAGLPCAITDASRVWGPDGLVRESKVTTGWADISAVGLDGRAVLIECKAEDGELRPAQRETLEHASLYGALAIVARSLEDVVEELDAAFRMYRRMDEAEDPQAARFVRAVRAYRRGTGGR